MRKVILMLLVLVVLAWALNGWASSGKKVIKIFNNGMVYTYVDFDSLRCVGGTPIFTGGNYNLVTLNGSCSYGENSK